MRLTATGAPSTVIQAKLSCHCVSIRVVVIMMWCMWITFVKFISSLFLFDFVFIWSQHTIVNNRKQSKTIILFRQFDCKLLANIYRKWNDQQIVSNRGRFICQCQTRQSVESSSKMLFELTVIILIMLCLWVIGRLLMMFDLVHLPKKRVHSWRHVKHANQVHKFCIVHQPLNKIDKFLIAGMLLFDMRNHVDVEWIFLWMLWRLFGHNVHPNGRQSSQMQKQVCRGCIVCQRPERTNCCCTAASVGQGQFTIELCLHGVRSRHRLPWETRFVWLSMLLVPKSNSHELLSPNSGWQGQSFNVHSNWFLRNTKFSLISFSDMWFWPIQRLRHTTE